MFLTAAFIIIFQTVSEYAATYPASYTCELFAHELRMGYALFYLKSDVRTLSGLNTGEEQSAMQNELSELSLYLNSVLFSFIKQSLSFMLTVVFLFYKNCRLTMLSILPVIPLILYCSFSGKMIRRHTVQCLEKKKQINGLTDTVLETFPIIQIYNAYRLIDDTMNRQLLTWQEAMETARYKTECLENIIKNLQNSQSPKKISEMTEEERAWFLVKMVCIEDIRAQKALSEALWL